MTIHEYFPTRVYTAALQKAGAREFNRRLLQECRQLREDDAAGRRWSAQNYPGGYTSYVSAHRLQRISPTFEALQRKLQGHVKAFAAAVQWDLKDRELSMTDCWINIMPRQTAHSLHLHPLSTLSGTYYVRVRAESLESNSKIPGWIASWRRRLASRMLGRRIDPGLRFPPKPGIWCCSRVGCATR